MPDVIQFYYADQDYGEFSNFARYPIELDGKTWPTLEHYFQAKKFIDAGHAEAIRQEKSPLQAANMGRDPNRPIRLDWDTVKDDIMRTAVLAKFSQHEQLRQLLLRTGNAEIVEHTSDDAYWGDAGDGTGENVLGKILMETRQKLRDGSQ